jgi:F0F1-type ATP synthase membrane subunit b/b'
MIKRNGNNKYEFDLGAFVQLLTFVCSLFIFYLTFIDNRLDSIENNQTQIKTQLVEHIKHYEGKKVNP